MNRFKPITSTRITSPLSDDEVRQKFALEPTAGGGRAQSLPPLSVTSRPATRSSLRRTTRFSSPTSDSSGSAPTNLDPIEDKRAFRTSTDGGDEGGYTIWYHTQAPYSLTTPRTLPSPPTPGAVYVHTDTNNGSKQVWVWTTSGTWCLFQEGDDMAHPLYKKRYLWVHSNGVPSWVVWSTLRSYRKARDSGSISSFGL